MAGPAWSGHFYILFIPFILNDVMNRIFLTYAVAALACATAAERSPRSSADVHGKAFAVLQHVGEDGHSLLHEE